MSIASITIVGNVGSEPEIRYLESGKPVANFSVCYNAYHKKEKVANWYKVEIWGRDAEYAANNIHRGNRVCVIGEPVIEAYVDKSGDAKPSGVIKNAKVSKFGDEQQGGGGATQGSVLNQNATQQGGSQPAGAGPDLDDIPF